MKYCRLQTDDPGPLISRIALLASTLLSLGLTFPVAAQAQLVGSATLESQYRWRGVDLSNGQPDLQLSLSYDHSSGLYGGVTGIAGETVRNGVQPLGLLTYAGYAVQAPDGLTWDAGVTESLLALYLPIRQSVLAADGTTSFRRATRVYDAEYTEVYGGVSRGDLSAHLYISPDYLHQNLRTAYLDVAAATRPLSWLKLSGHVGALTPIQGSAWPSSERERFDLGVGAAWELRHGELQLAWSGTTPQVEYPLGYHQARSALILSLTGYF
jgi:Bacterial protein of unknown function (Gcw_chp)